MTVLYAVCAVTVLAVLLVRMSEGKGTGGNANVGGLNYVVGPMGSGKSMFGVRVIVQALCAGKYVVTNVRLLDGWEQRVAAKEFPRDRGERRGRRARWLSGFYIYEQDLAVAMRYLPPCAKCGEDPRSCSHVGPFQEGRAVFVWDESHNDLNNRDYQGHGSDAEMRNREKERRRLVVRWATHLRKLGYVGYLLSQHHENTDAQLRRICNHLIRLQNQRNRGGFGSLLPKRFTLFLVYWYPAHLADGTTRVEAVKSERYMLPWTRDLYDSWETFHGLHDELSEQTTPIVLPAGGRRLPDRPLVAASAPLEETPPRANGSIAVTGESYGQALARARAETVQVPTSPPAKEQEPRGTAEKIGQVATPKSSLRRVLVGRTGPTRP